MKQNKKLGTNFKKKMSNILGTKTYLRKEKQLFFQ